MNTALVIMLHGVGSQGIDLEPLASAWREDLPDVDHAAPDAPDPFSHGPGRQWFSIDGVTPANRAGRVADARTGFDAVVGGIIARHGLSGRLDRVALLGFSQGAIMALDALASGRWPVAGIVAFSGRLASPTPLEPALDTRALLVHGAADPVIPADDSRQAAAGLQALGVDVGCHILPRVAHGISPEGAALAASFLGELFGARQSQP